MFHVVRGKHDICRRSSAWMHLFADVGCCVKSTPWLHLQINAGGDEVGCGVDFLCELVTWNVPLDIHAAACVSCAR